jgi:hypothetical protein
MLGIRQCARLWLTVIGLGASVSGEMHDYVGSEACVSYHPSIAETYQASEMGRSFYLPLETELIEDYFGGVRVYDKKSDLAYEPVRRDGSLYQRETRRGEDGSISHELEHRVDYVVGSGSHNRRYISERDGVLYELPLTWYTEQGIWDLSPGYDEQNLRFGRPIVAECLNCHNSYAAEKPHSQGRYEQVPHGIGCERCHGPARSHVAAYGEVPRGKRACWG